ncbi:MAG: DUF6056 family protein [Oscillospiraceae bacterium]
MEEKNELNRYKGQKMLCILLFIVFLLGVIPLIYIGRYNFPSVDDYASAFKVRGAMEEGYGAIGAVLINVVRVHFRWQGTFLANLFIYATPALLNYRVYKLVPLFMYTIFFFGVMFFSKSVVRLVDKEDRYAYKILALGIIISSIQQVPVPSEGFYWWTGSIMYTGCFCLQMVFLGCVFKCYFANTEGKIKWYTGMLMCLFSFILGGANYVTALMNCGYMLLAIIYMIYQKSPKTKWVVAVFVCSALGLLVNVTAPGNFNRMTEVDSQWEFSVYSIPAMILKCFQEGWDVMIKSFHINIVGFMAILVPVFYVLTKKMKFNFKLPLAVTIFTFCIYCAQYAPGVFTNTGVPGRMENVIFYTFILLIFFNVFYWTGYVQKNLMEKCISKAKLFPKKAHIVKLAAEHMFIFGMFAACLTAPSTDIAVKGLLDGTTQEYGTHMASLINQCMDENVKVPTVSAFKNRPLHLSFYILEPEENSWGASEMARHYGKEKIVILDD